MQGEEALDDWIRRNSTGLGWVAYDDVDVHGPFDDPIESLRHALARSDYGDFVTLSSVTERVDPVDMATVSADRLTDELYAGLADAGYAPLGGLEDMPEEALEALGRDLAAAVRRTLAAWRSAYPAHLPASVWRASGEERLVTAIDLTTLLSFRRESA